MGTVLGPVLQLNSKSDDPRATALNLNVTDGKAPLKVANPDAGTAINLDADRLDGKEALSFLPRSMRNPTPRRYRRALRQARRSPAIPES